MHSVLITGGNQGLGQCLTAHYHATSVSRQTGHDIIINRDEIANLSLRFDVFINNAYDGVPDQSFTDYGQVQLLQAVAQTWQQHQHRGHIINIGGVGGVLPNPPLPGWEGYGANKAALRFHSREWSQAFRLNQVPFRTSLISLDRLATPAGSLRPSWTGNGHDLSDVAHMIDLCLTSQGNTCVEEITAWVNLDHKQ